MNKKKGWILNCQLSQAGLNWLVFRLWDVLGRKELDKKLRDKKKQYCSAGIRAATVHYSRRGQCYCTGQDNPDPSTG